MQKGSLTASRTFLAFIALLLLPQVNALAAGEKVKHPVGLSPGPEWKVLSMFSGTDSYYSIVEENGEKLIRARYKPPQKTVILYRQVDSPPGCSTMSWKWRVFKPPFKDGLKPGRIELDNPAAVYVYFQNGLRKYVIKYVVSVQNPQGANFLSNDSTLLRKLHFVVLRGLPLKIGEWVKEEVNFAADFRKYFLDGKPDGEVPPVTGIGILSDGDDTGSVVETDYAGFELR